MENNVLIYLALVVGTVFLLSQSLIIPVFGEGKKIRERLRLRLEDIDRASDTEAVTSILREKYLRSLAPWEAWLETLPAMETLSRTIEQAGRKMLAHRLVLLAVVLGLITVVLAWIFFRLLPAAIVAGLIVFYLPFMKIRRDRDKRMETLEAQMPEALDVMRRALMAGHPFNASLNLVSEDMDEPIAKEFRLTFADINYGNDARRALLGLLSRVPSVTVMAFVTSVLVQKETGGNLAEILGQISAVIRGRYRFQRKVKTLSAEGRMSAKVLALVPIVMVAALTLTSPDYLPVMFDHPTGQNLLMFTVVWGAIGILIVRRMLRIEV